MASKAEHGSIAEVGSPVDLPPAAVDRARPLGWATVTIAAATLLLALFNATSLSGWSDELTPGPVSERVAKPVATWSAATASLDHPRAALKALWDKLRALRFGDEQPGEG